MDSAGTAAAFRDVRMEQAAHQDWSAAYEDFSSVEALWTHLTTSTNVVRAVEQVRWDALLPEGATVLDLGCGMGWLSAMLSRRPEVARVVAWDGSPRMLSDLLPEMVELLDGRREVIEPVCGNFTPLLTVDDESLDLVVMSSAFHHCEAPEALLSELERVTARGGAVLLLNETPWRVPGMLWFVTRMVIAHLGSLATGRDVRWPGYVAFDHVLYDRELGDRAYTLKGWRALMRRAGWTLEVQPTGLTTYPASFRPPSRFEPELVHLLLRPMRSR
jgi:ubiquinone/menaquinone biosynthesis C-methylase UbiE